MTGKKRVLCVEDHLDTCELITRILENYEVVGEHSKAGALHQAATEKYDLILVDYHLPDGTGLELCELIRAFDPITPILFVTSSHSVTHEQVAAVGAQGVVRKDRISHMLPAAVNRVFEVRLLDE